MRKRIMLLGVFLAASILMMVPCINAFNNLSAEDKVLIKSNQDILKNTEDTDLCEKLAILSTLAYFLGFYILSDLLGITSIICVLLTGSSSSNSCSICVN